MTVETSIRNLVQEELKAQIGNKSFWKSIAETEEGQEALRELATLANDLLNDGATPTTFNTQQAADYLNMEKGSVYNAKSRGKLKPISHEGTPYYTKEELDRYKQSA